MTVVHTLECELRAAQARIKELEAGHAGTTVGEPNGKETD